MKQKILVLILSLTSAFGWAFTRPSFTNDDFHNLLRTSALHQTAGVIYTWSPRMNLSLLGIQELLTICQNHDLELTVILDPHISDQEADRVDKPFYEPNLHSFRLASDELVKTGFLIHYPGLLIYKNGVIQGPFRPGYDEPERVEAYILRRLQ